MAYVTERINNKAQATLTNEKLVEGYIGKYDLAVKKGKAQYSNLESAKLS